MFYAFLYQTAEMCLVTGKSLSDKSRSQGERNGQGIKGRHDNAVMLLFCFKAGCCRWGGLSLGQPVNPIVMNQEGKVDISPDSMDEMVSAFSIAITIAGVYKDVKFMVGHFGPCGQGKGPAMQ